MQEVLNPKIITCYIPHHQSLKILEELSKEKGIVMANKSNARGSSYTTDFLWIEMEMLEVIVEASRADEIYTFLYDRANIGDPQGGLIFQHALSRASDYKTGENP